MTAVEQAALELHLESCVACRSELETRAAAAVVHENVVPIHCVAEAADLPYFVMPYLKKRFAPEAD